MCQAGDTLLLLSKYYLASPTDSLWCCVSKHTADISEETARKRELGLFHAHTLLTEVWDNTVSLAFGISVSAVSDEGATLLPSYTRIQKAKVLPFEGLPFQDLTLWLHAKTKLCSRVKSAYSLLANFFMVGPMYSANKKMFYSPGQRPSGDKSWQCCLSSAASRPKICAWRHQRD